MSEPTLTDLIATVVRKHRAGAAMVLKRDTYCGCGVSVDLRDHPAHIAAHVALVVEQHTNGRHEWPKTTPSGFTYERPTTHAALEHMIDHMAQSEIECWDEAERPPEPVWEMIGIAQQEVLRLRAYIDTIVRSNARAALEGEQQ